jgi:hypothetical protein
MIKNWKATAWLSSPLAGEPPYLDAILEWEMSFRLGYKRHAKLTRDTPLSEITRVPMPLAKRTIAGHDVYCCSDPILPHPLGPEWVDRLAKQIDADFIAQLLAPKEQKNISVTSGPYKARYAPVRVRLVDRVCWFFRGNEREIRRILKSVFTIGKYRGIGYGIIDRWDYEDMGENDYSIFAPSKNGKILMKTIPYNSNLENVSGYKVSFGGGKPPYWHPENYMEIAVPC